MAVLVGVFMCWSCSTLSHQYFVSSVHSLTYVVTHFGVIRGFVNGKTDQDEDEAEVSSKLIGRLKCYVSDLA